MKNLCIMKNTQPKLAVCITMYNENESELMTTMEGVIQNYNSMYMDENLSMRQEDIIVTVICDGYDAVP